MLSVRLLLHKLQVCVLMYVPMSEKIKTPESVKDFPLAALGSMIMLATSGFGVVVALAWNEFIKSIVEQFIDPFLGKSTGVASLLIYAAIMTLLAVMVTMQLSKIQRKLEQVQEAQQARQAKKNTKKR